MNSKKTLKIKLVSCSLALLSILLICAFAFFLRVVFGGQYGPLFDTPFKFPGTCWYSNDPKAELLIDENFKDDGTLAPTEFIVYGEKVIYYMCIHEPSRTVMIYRDETETSCVFEGKFSTGPNKFIIKIYKCNDAFFEGYDEIVLHKK